MEPNGKTVALLVAAGSGSRAGGDLPKQYRSIAGRAVLAHALDGLDHPAIDEIRVVIGRGQEPLYGEAVRGRALPSPITGGAERQDSVRAGLEADAASGGASRILVHDSARPFLPACLV